MSNDCSSGTPAFIIVASCRVKSAMSLPPIDPPPPRFCFFQLDAGDALAAQKMVDGVLARGSYLAAHDLAAFVLALVGERYFLGTFGRALACGCCCGCHLVLPLNAPMMPFEAVFVKCEFPLLSF
jgi:hypothetical protein